MAELNRPLDSVPSDASVNIFKNIITKAYDKVAKTLAKGDYSTRLKRSQLLRELDLIVEESDEAVKAWVKTQVPAFYERGMFEATKGIVDNGDDLRMSTNFIHFHKEAIEAISQDTYFHIAGGMKGISDTGQRFVSMGAKQSIIEQIATGRITGDTRREISKNIQNTLKSEGITSLVDKGGKEWDLERYGDMLARTKLTQAHNSGVSNRLLESGYDLVQVSGHMGSCELCRPFEYEVLSVSGRNPAYMSMDTAQAGGLFHPNCKHTVTPYHNDFLDASVIFDPEVGDYVPYTDYMVSKVNTNNDYITALRENDIVPEKNFVVYRAEDSQGRGSALGAGKYFALDKENVKQYGTDVKSYVLDPKTKLLHLAENSDLDKFQNEMQEKFSKRYAEILDKESDPEKAIAKAVTEYAKSLGYEGIVSDDKIFGSVVFDSEKLIPLNTPRAEKALELIQSQDLKKYETAFNTNNVKTMEFLREKYPTDSRFKIHMQFGKVTEK